MTLNTFSWVHWTFIFLVKCPNLMSYCLMGVPPVPPYLLKVLSFLLGIASALFISGSYIYRSTDEI